jgi:hypothetical protein
MLLRSGIKTPWPVIPDKKQTFETWDRVESILKSNTRLILLFYDKTMNRMICVQMSYMLLNNKKFLKDPKFQRILKCMLKVLHRATDLPEYVAQLVPRLEKLQMSRIRWTILRASVKFLSLHSRAVVTANHPSRIDFTIRD